jgi:hypothetical protein
VLTGSVGIDSFLTTGYSVWFQQQYDNYQPDTAIILSFPEPEQIQITVVGGTWCSDTRLHLPAFIRVIDTWNYPRSRLRLIWVDRSKKIKLTGYKKLNISSVPTFIFYNAKGKEMGRIVETPLSTVEGDMKTILLKK